MTSEQAWKTKYFDALKENEGLQQKASFQFETLKKVLINLGAVAQGLDDSVDQSVSALSSKLRGGTGQAVMDQLRAFELTVSASLDRRADERSHWRSAFFALSDSLKQLKLSPSAQNELKQFRANVDRLPSDAAVCYDRYLDLLSKLEKLQNLVLAGAAEPDKSFWQRVKSGRRLQSPEDSVGDAGLTSAPASRDSEPEPLDDNALAPTEEHHTTDRDTLDVDELRRVLSQMADAITPPDDIDFALQQLKSKLAKPVAHQNFSAVMREMRDILISCFNLADSEFSEYLVRVNDSLQDIGDRLNTLISDSQLGREAANSLEQAVNAHMCTLRDSIDDETDLNSLKANVKSQIDTIQSVLEQYQAERDANEPLSAQLKILVEKVQTIEAESKETKDLLAEERYKATHDPLTRLPNRVAYNDRIAQEWRRFQRYGRPLSISVCDIDHFKSFNDRFGHQTGDKVLCVVAKLLQERVREVDLVARYGGEEFVIIFPETSADNALMVADQVRTAIATKAFAAKDQSVDVTLSFGVTGFVESDTMTTAFERADKALYEAKNSGRNRCCLL